MYYFSPLAGTMLRAFYSCTDAVSATKERITTNKGVTMGLDQYAGFRDSNGEIHEEFYWRKHARLQHFFADMYDLQNKDKKHNSQLQHLGFNGGQGGVKITEDIVNKLEEAYKNDYYDYFAPDGFFWGQQFQEEQVREYKAQDEKFIAWCKEQLKNKKDIGYDCSW
jgi:hypothetical protein